MRWSSLALCLTAVLPSALTNPVPFPGIPNVSGHLEERASTFAITGIAGAVYPRLEVREMLNNHPNQWTLFILAMQAFQAQSTTNQLSYYQIAGIHGVPRVSWDGVAECSTCSGADGYCTHDSVLFPAWHRAYMALFEMEFMAAVNNIITTFPTAQQATLKTAASTMRMPFWDWAAQPKPGYPTLATVISEKMITVNGPSGSESILNPLFRYDFTSADMSQLVYSPFIDWAVTLRYPNSDASTASSVETNCTSAFDAIRPSLQDQVYQLFTTCTDYLHFSNDDAGSSSTSCSNSLEGIHNTVHTTAGGGTSSISGGHMTYLSLAAFDPLFWLHHCNVDRLFAMWQTLNPTSYGASQVAPHNTWTIAQGSTQDQTSPLTPFHKDTTGDFWTTNAVQNWSTTFHYTYPEFADSDGSAAAIRSYVNNLYGPSATATAGSSKRTAAPEPVENVARAVPTSSVAASNGSLYQYVANINTTRYALNGSYSVYLFMGEPASEDPSTWLLAENLIGTQGIMAQPNMTANVVVAGSIPLTRSLTAQVACGALSSLSEADVIPFLQKNLEWRISGPEGNNRLPSTVPDFIIAVVASTATVPEDSSCFPVYSQFIELTEITHGKNGGANITSSS